MQNFSYHVDKNSLHTVRIPQLNFHTLEPLYSQTKFDSWLQLVCPWSEPHGAVSYYYILIK